MAVKIDIFIFPTNCAIVFDRIQNTGIILSSDSFSFGDNKHIYLCMSDLDDKEFDKIAVKEDFS